MPAVAGHDGDLAVARRGQGLPCSRDWGGIPLRRLPRALETLPTVRFRRLA
jgi:hypothetical protein